MTLVIALIAGSIVSEDVTAAAAGLMVARGELGFAAALGACLAGIVAGDLLMFGAGRWLGRPALARVPLRWIVREPALREASLWLERRAGWAMVLSRVFPGARGPTYVAAGLLDARSRPLVVFYVLGVLVWTPILVGSGALAGTLLGEWITAWRENVPLLIAALVAVLLFWRLAAALIRRAIAE